jgi:hypothetical protein
MADSIYVAHRLLASRIAYLIGMKDENGTANLIPVSNLISCPPSHSRRRWRCTSSGGHMGSY